MSSREPEMTDPLDLAIKERLQEWARPQRPPHELRRRLLKLARIAETSEKAPIILLDISQQEKYLRQHYLKQDLLVNYMMLTFQSNAARMVF
jgi:hypothetical protein